MHSFYTKLAIGGRFTDATPASSATVGGESYVGSIDPSANVHWQGGVVIGGEFPFEWWHFEHLALRLKVGTYGPPHNRYVVKMVDQGAEGGSYDTRNFNPHQGAQGKDEGHTLVVFRGSGPVRLRPSSDGRQFGPSVLAPFADVVLEGRVGFVDGLIISRSLSGTDSASQVQLHGEAYKGPIICDPCDPWEPYVAPPTAPFAPTQASTSAAPTPQASMSTMMTAPLTTAAPASAPAPTVAPVASAPDIAPLPQAAPSASASIHAKLHQAADAEAGRAASAIAARATEARDSDQMTVASARQRWLLLLLGMAVLSAAMHAGRRRLEMSWEHLQELQDRGSEVEDIHRPLSGPLTPPIFSYEKQHRRASGDPQRIPRGQTELSAHGRLKIAKAKTPSGYVWV